MLLWLLITQYTFIITQRAGLRFRAASGVKFLFLKLFLVIVTYLMRQGIEKKTTFCYPDMNAV